MRLAVKISTRREIEGAIDRSLCPRLALGEGLQLALGRQRAQLHHIGESDTLLARDVAHELNGLTVENERDARRSGLLGISAAAGRMFEATALPRSVLTCAVEMTLR